MQRATQNSNLKLHHGLLMALFGSGLLLLLALAPIPGANARTDFTPTPTPTLPPDALLPHYGALVQLCQGGPQPRGRDFEARGMLVTTFSRDALWLVEVERERRYPLPETRPCGPNCQPSPDHRSLLYVDAETHTFWLMNIDGTGRREVIPQRVNAVEWWDAEHWLVWNTSALPYLLPINGGEPFPLDDPGVFSIQPGGYHGLRLSDGDPLPILELVDMQSGEAQPLAAVEPYFGGTYWSPDGSRLAYIGRGERDLVLGIYGAELYLIQPGTTSAVRLTNLTQAYGAVRIAGAQEETAISWSPDGRYLAFWVIEIIGRDMAANVGHALIHVLDTLTGQVTAYCGYATNEHTPNPPALIWSPDSRYLAFGVNEPDDERGALLIVLDTQTGVYTEISEGVYAAYGTYDPVMWGIP